MEVTCDESVGGKPERVTLPPILCELEVCAAAVYDRYFHVLALSLVWCLSGCT